MYKPLADSTLHSMTKKEIIELLRIAEHNAKVSQEWVAQQAKNLKDWEPVVRCKNCTHYDLGVCLKIYSDGNAQKDSWQSRNPNDFCSYGERRGDHLALEAETTQIIDGCCTACGAFMDCCEAADYKYCPYCAKRIV